MARHTFALKPLVDFYVNIIGLEVLGTFENHSGYDGIFLGKKGLDWHLEFTSTHEPVEHAFKEEEMFVFYPTSQKEYVEIVERISDNQLSVLQAKNPYWNANGITIKDPDGFLVVISNLKIST